MRGMRIRWIVLGLLAAAGVATAAGDPRGWSEGQPAEKAPEVMARKPLGAIELPADFQTVSYTHLTLPTNREV